MSNILDLWKLSPIVGEIRDKQASIIFELYNKKLSVKYSIDNAEKINVDITKMGPTNIIINFDKMGTFKISWFIDDEMQFEHLIVTSNEISKLIFVSCDLLEADTKHSLWDKITFELVPNKRTAIMHLGDQAYMDPAFNECKKIIEEPINADQMKKICFDQYSQRYCATWKPHNNLLANVSNYYIWDDHEIANNIILNNINDNQTKYISDIATQAYNLYQQSFHINKTFIINSYCWYKYIDNQSTSVMLAIERTSREIKLEEIFEAIINLNKINTIERLILCFSSAPIPTPHGCDGKIYERLIGFGKFWNKEKLESLYVWLFNWMGSNKEVIITGGDVHFGVHGYVIKNKIKILVLIASPITNQPQLNRILASNGMHGCHIVSNKSIDEIIIFATISSKARRCYGVVNLESMPIDTKIVYSKDKFPKGITKYLKTMLKFS